MTASSFWGEIARELNLDLQIVNAESREGEILKADHNLSGVPCLLVSPDTVVYGIQYKYEDAKRILQKIAANDP